MKSPIIFKAFLWLSVRFKIPVTSADGLSADRFLAPSLPLPSDHLSEGHFDFRKASSVEWRAKIHKSRGLRLAAPSFFSQSVTHPANKPAEEVPALCLSQGRRRRAARGREGIRQLQRTSSLRTFVPAACHLPPSSCNIFTATDRAHGNELLPPQGHYTSYTHTVEGERESGKII